ncbi:MAG: twin-arginine translocase subunit TatC [Kiritimatiellaeota bacterium]|nr:twin-arginine translocase subunit TatC [Kiritimatiellota bacterium]
MKKRKKIERAKMNLWEHLEELRWTAFKIVIALLLTTTLSLFMVDSIYDALTRPMAIVRDANPEFQIKQIVTSPFDPVIIKFKLSLLAGIVLGFPIVTLLLWRFVAPGLEKNENKAFIAVATLGSFSFAAGITCGYFALAPLLSILLKFKLEGAEHYWKIKDFMSFAFYWLLCSGLVFEIPLAMVSLARLGIVQTETLRKKRPYVLVGALVVAAIITPPDPISMLLVGIPLILLYEVGILLCAIWGGDKRSLPAR